MIFEDGLKAAVPLYRNAMQNVGTDLSSYSDDQVIVMLALGTTTVISLLQESAKEITGAMAGVIAVWPVLEKIKELSDSQSE